MSADNHRGGGEPDEGEPDGGKGDAESLGDKEPGTPESRTCPCCGAEFDTVFELYRHKCPSLETPAPGVREPGRAPARAEPGGIPVASIFRSVYTHNPFYAVSAALVLYGISLAFGGADDSTGWALLGTLAGYACLMALAGVLVVRLGKIWQDARSILLVLVLLFLAISVAFDRFVIETPATGVPLLLVGLMFSVAVSESVLFGTGIRLRALYKWTYYAFLGLLYLYPLLLLALLRLSTVSEMGPLVWGLYLFPLAAGAVSLLLVPAIRRGAAYAEENGTPWSWPWFPWILFGVLAGCAGVRSYWLTLSFYPVEGMLSPFGAYFLVPMVLALAVLLLEAGLATKRGWLRDAGIALPALALVMIFPGQRGGHVHEQFVGMIARTATSPALLGALSVLAFYVYAWLRRQRLAEVGVVIALAVASVVGRETTGLRSLVSPRFLLLGALAIVEIVQLLRRRTSWRAAVVVAGLVAALAAAFKGTWFNSAGGIVPLHLAYAGALIVGACFKDRLARFLQSAGALVLAVVFLAALFFGDRLLPGSAGWSRTTYVVAAFVLAPLYWLIVRNVQYMRVLLLNVTATTLWALGGAYILASRLWRKRGAALIFWGGASFVLAALISVLKTGALRKLTGPVRELAGLDALGVWLKKNSVRIVVLVLIVGLASLLLLPGLCAARERARRTSCASNLKQIGYGVHLYSSDHDERFPESLPVLYREGYLTDHKVFLCWSARRRSLRHSPGPGEPLTEDHMFFCYVSGMKADDNGEYVVAFEEEWNHRGDGLNVLFIGGNVAWQRDIGEFHEKLGKQLTELKAAGRRVQVLRPSWSRYPELPEHGLWGTSRRGALTRTVAAAAAVLLALDVGLLAAYLATRRRSPEAVAEVDG